MDLNNEQPVLDTFFRDQVQGAPAGVLHHLDDCGSGKCEFFVQELYINAKKGYQPILESSDLVQKIPNKE